MLIMLFRVLNLSPFIRVPPMDTIIISNSLPSFISHPNTTSTSQLHTTARFAPSNHRKSPSPLSLGPPNRTRQVSLRRLSISCTAGVTEIDETQFSDTVLKSDRPVLVEFVAKWCGPCRLIAPAMEWIAQEYKDKVTVVKIDHDANPKLIEQYKVYGLPTFIIFKSGKEVPQSRREGAITKVKLKDYLDAMLESISVA